jgi:16S rRNA G1207 methylase RsmC
VFEAGSGIDVVSATIAEIIGSENIVCCEANLSAAALLRRTLALNGYRTTVYEGVLV